MSTISECYSGIPGRTRLKLVGLFTAKTSLTKFQHPRKKMNQPIMVRLKSLASAPCPTRNI